MDKSKFAVATYNKIADVYTNQYFKDLTDIPHIDKFLERLPGGAKILDIGCGSGQFSKYMISKGFKAEGIDLSSEMVKVAKERVPEAEFGVGDMRNLSFDDNTFDGLLVAYSLIHIPSEEIEKTLIGFLRILKKNGYIQIIAQKGDPDKVVAEPLMKGERMFINFFTKKRLSDYLQKASFRVEYIKVTDMQDPESLSDRVIYVIARKL